MSSKKRPVQKRTKLRSERTRRAVDTRLAQEELILSVAEEFYVMIGKLGLTRSACARQLRVPESHVKRVLEGRNMTLRTVASMVFDLGHRVEVRFVPIT